MISIKLRSAVVREGTVKSDSSAFTFYGGLTVRRFRQSTSIISVFRSLFVHARRLYGPCGSTRPFIVLGDVVEVLTDKVIEDRVW